MSKEVNGGYLGTFLNAQELLKNRGLKCVAWEEWEKISRVIPKTGQKQFEPNGSWLEIKTVENGIKSRKDLIGLEKVDRHSQLAVAEWLPSQRKAKVTKKSGQDWSNFGQEINSVLYLIPEEALILLEMNNLELYWNGMPLSIQQAYTVLFDSNDFEYSVDHYRVYSQLVKHGYRLQRFTKKLSLENRHNIGKKVIVEPENGLRMTKNHSNSEEEETMQISEEIFKKTEEKSSNKENNTAGISSENTDVEDEKIESKSINGDTKSTESIMEISEDRSESQNDQIHTDNSEKVLKNNSTLLQNIEKRKSSKVEIIAEETVLGNIKIIKNTNGNSPILSNTVSKWPGSRIQRNVKLLPKRNDKPFPSSNAESREITVINNNNDGHSKQLEKRSVPFESTQINKKAKQEVIDISDDEIEEIPRPMTRMEILNLLPNIASHSVITMKISRGYIPHSIKPQKDVYHYGRWKWLHINKMDSQARTNAVQVKDNLRKPSTSNERASYQPQPTIQVNQYTNRRTFHTYRSFGFMSQERFMHQQSWIGRNTFIQQNFCQFNQRNMWSRLDIQSVYNSNPIFGAMQNIMSMSSIRFRNPFQSNYQQNFQISYQQNTRQYMYPNVFGRGAPNGNFWRPQANPNVQRNPQKKSLDVVEISNNDENNVPSFTKLPNVSSWSELKDKWQEEKTITIDDEEPGETTDCGEVQVVEQVKPLLKPESSMNFEEIYEKLRIIKLAPERSVRQKKTDYVLFYNVYSNVKPYKKASPGNPLCRLLVIREKNERFFDTMKLCRLQQDTKDIPIVIAHIASTAISFLQLGFVSVPNLY